MVVLAVAQPPAARDDDARAGELGTLGLREFLPGDPVSYTHLRAHETVLDLVCRLLLEKKNNTADVTPQQYRATVSSA